MARHVTESKLPFEAVTTPGDEGAAARDDAQGARDQIAGRVDRIWIKRGSGGLMDPVETAILVAASGIRGNANRRGRRQVTIISAERWRAVCATLGADVPPQTRRANVMVSGIDLEKTRGRVLRIGAATLRINGETRPCWQMEEAHKGLQAAMDPHWGGGAFAEVVEGGEIKVGDPVEWEAGDGSRPAAQHKGHQDREEHTDF
jgi:MOSC domain-containing protein YiiM